MAHDHEHGPDCDHEHDHEHGPECNHDHGHEHAHDESERQEQTVTVDDAGPARKKLTIEIPMERIAKKFETSFEKLRSDAAIPGFRRGRVPMRLLEKRFGASVRDEVRTELVSESYAQAVDENKLEVVGEPEIKDFDKLTLPDNGPFKFDVEVEVVPQFDLPDFEGIAVTKKTFAISDEDITSELAKLQDRYGRIQQVEDAAIAGDFLQCDVTIRAADAAADAEPLIHQPGTYVLVPSAATQGKGQVAGIVIEDLSSKIEGRKAGDEFKIELTGPSGHENEAIKDKPIVIEARVEKVERVAPAELSALVEQFGLESEDQLKERVRESVQQRRDNEQKLDMREQVCQYLLANTDFELPKGLTTRQTARVLRRIGMEMAYRGASNEEIQQRLAEQRASSEDEARKQLKLFFILNKAADNLEVEVGDSEVNGQIAAMAWQQGRRPEKLRQQMQKSGEIEQLYTQIRDQKALDTILEKAKVTEEPAAASA